VAAARRVYGHRGAMPFEQPPVLAAYTSVPVSSTLFPVHAASVFRGARTRSQSRVRPASAGPTSRASSGTVTTEAVRGRPSRAAGSAGTSSAKVRPSSAKSRPSSAKSASAAAVAARQGSVAGAEGDSSSMTVQHLPANALSDSSRWGWQQVRGADGRVLGKKWVDSYKGGYSSGQLSPRRKSWVESGGGGTSSLNAFLAAEKTPSGSQHAWLEYRARQTAMGWVPDAGSEEVHFSRWRPTPHKRVKRTGGGARRKRKGGNKRRGARDASSSRKQLASLQEKGGQAAKLSSSASGRRSRGGTSSRLHRAAGSAAAAGTTQAQASDVTQVSDKGTQCDELGLDSLIEHGGLEVRVLAMGGFASSVDTSTISCTLRVGDRLKDTASVPMDVAPDDPCLQPPDNSPCAYFLEPLRGRQRLHLQIQCRAAPKSGYRMHGPDVLAGLHLALSPRETMGTRLFALDAQVSQDARSASACEVAAADSTGMPPTRLCPHGWVAVQYRCLGMAHLAEGDFRSGLMAELADLEWQAHHLLGMCTLTVERARHLPRLGSKKLAVDPFAVVYYRGQCFKTRVVLSTSAPQWNASFELPVQDFVDEVRIKIFDWNAYKFAEDAKFELIGSCSFSLLDELAQAPRAENGELSREHWTELYRSGQQHTLHRCGDVFCRTVFKPKYGRANPETTASHCVATLILGCKEARGLHLFELGHRKGNSLVLKISLLQPQMEKQQHVASSTHIFKDPVDGWVVQFDASVAFIVTDHNASARLALYTRPVSGEKETVLDSVVIGAVHLIGGDDEQQHWYPFLQAERSSHKAPGGLVENYRNLRIISRLEDKGRVGSQVNQALGTAVTGDRTNLNMQATLRADAFEADAHINGALLVSRQMNITVTRQRATASVTPGVNTGSSSRRSERQARALDQLAAQQLDVGVVGIVSVAVLRAKDLNQVLLGARLSDPDPFCVICHEEDEEGTTTVAKTRDPVWTNSAWHSFSCTHWRSSISVKIYSRDPLGQHVLLGTVAIGLRETWANSVSLNADFPSPWDEELRTNGVNQDGWFTVFGRGNSLQPCGRVQIVLQLRRALTRIQPASAALRRVISTSSMLHRATMDDAQAVAPRIVHDVEVPDVGQLVTIEVTVLKLHDLEHEDKMPLVRVRLANESISDSTASYLQLCRRSKTAKAHVFHEEFQKAAVYTRLHVLAVTTMQSFARLKMARRRIQHLRSSLVTKAAKTQPPEWNESFQLHTRDATQYLICEVLGQDQSTRAAVFLGMVSQRVQDVIKHQKVERWFPMELEAPPIWAGPVRDHWRDELVSNADGQLYVRIFVAIRLQSYYRGYCVRRQISRSMAVEHQIVFAVGGPGSGRHTLCSRLADEFDVAQNPCNDELSEYSIQDTLVYLDMGHLLMTFVRALSSSNSTKERSHAEAIRTVMSDGDLVSNSTISKVVRQAVLRSKNRFPGSTILLSGFPLNIEQLDAYIKDFPSNKPATVMYFECDEEEMYQRCVASKDYPDEGQLAKRLALFHKYCRGEVVEAFKKQGLCATIDAKQPLEDCYRQSHQILQPVMKRHSVRQAQAVQAHIDMRDRAVEDYNSKRLEHKAEANDAQALGVATPGHKETIEATDVSSKDQENKPNQPPNGTPDGVPDVPSLKLRLQVKQIGLMQTVKAITVAKRWRKQTMMIG
jgi:adenylate kinase family enzyme